MPLTIHDKEKLLKAIEEDREFRYALMGLLGFKEILDRITELAKGQQRLEERQQRLEERFAKLEERQQRLEERFVKLEEQFVKLEERQQKLEERQQRLEEEMKETRRVLMTIAHRFGILTEEAFRQGMRFVVEDVLKVAKVERWVYRDEKGVVYGYPSIIEVDVAIKDKEHILVEVKSRVSKSDVAELYKIGKLYEEVEGVKPRLVIVGGFIDTDTNYLARKLGVEIIPVITK